MALTVEQALARVPQFAGVSGLQISPLGGGITNQNFRVDAGGESFVLRIAGEKTELLGIDRRNEYAANRAAAEIGLAPEPIYFIEPEGYLVTRFIAARPLPREEMGQPENIRRVAAALVRLHAGRPIPGLFSPFRMAESYAETARQYGVTFPPRFQALAATMQEIESAFQRDPFTPRPCHNDLLNENFLTQDSGGGPRLWILDWEYAGMGDPAFDLANFAVHHGFTDEQDHVLLETYFGGAPARRIARHKLMKIASDMREAMWGMVQIGISKLDFDFQGYADKHFNRMADMARDPRYGQWLREFEQGITD